MKILLKYAIIAAIFSLFIGCSDTGDGGYDGKTIVCFGNSLTEGYGAGKGKSYPDYLGQKVNIPVVNLGRSGMTAEEAVDSVKRYSSEFESAAVVVIELGVNDLLHRAVPFFGSINHDFVKDTVEKSLEKILDYIESLEGERKIYMAKFYNREVADSLLKKDGLIEWNGFEIQVDYDYSFAYEEYENMFGRLKSKYDIEIIEDIWDGIWGKYDLMYDENDNGKLDILDIHPNAEGYEKMAEHYFNAMKNFLKDNNLTKT